MLHNHGLQNVCALLHQQRVLIELLLFDILIYWKNLIFVACFGTVVLICNKGKFI
jgi:hypothetical protein